MDFFIRARRLDMISLSIPIVLIALGYSLGIGSILMPYISMVCTVYGVGFVYIIYWLFFLCYNYAFDIFVYKNLDET